MKKGKDKQKAKIKKIYRTNKDTISLNVEQVVNRDLLWPFKTESIKGERNGS